MSTVVRPSGPLPARVYWVRRLLLLAIVLLVILAVVRLVGGGGDPASGESTAADPDAEVTGVPAEPETERSPSSPTTKQTSRRSTRSDRGPVVRTVSQRLDLPSGPCDLTLVRVTPEASQPAYAGRVVPLRLGLTTTQPTACTLALNAERLLVAVTSAGEVVWTSSECPSVVPELAVVLRPYWTSGLDLVWSGQRSARRCASDAADAPPGEYELEVAALTGEPASVSFTLDPPPEPPDVQKDDRPGDDRVDESAAGGGTDDGSAADETTDGGSAAGGGTDDEQSAQ
jgi:hypothetical protein